MKNFFLLILLTIWADVASARTQSYDLPRMNAFPTTLGNLTALPSSPITASSDFTVVDRPVPLWMQQISRDIQLNVFGHELISLKYGDDSDNVMTADYKTATIWVGEEQTSVMSPEFIRFTLAHEISHFIHEMSVLQNGGTSFNGTASAYQFDYFVFRATMPEASVDAVNRGYLDLMSWMHVEVDLYALLILRSLNWSIPFEEILADFASVSSAVGADAAGIDVQRRASSLSAFRDGLPLVFE